MREKKMRSKKTLIPFLVITILVIGSAYGLYDHFVGGGAGTGTDQIEPQARKEAPDFTVYDSEGNKVSLSDLQGKPVVMNFWASWCTYCEDEFPYFEDAYERYGDEVTFMMINASETQDVIDTYIDEEGYSFPVYNDAERDAATKYDISSVPATYFIDENGRIAKEIIGATDKETILANVSELLGSSQ